MPLIRNALSQKTVCCVGAGPANLSLAALSQATDLPQLNFKLLEKAHSLTWHTAQIMQGTTLQNEWYRDLVTPVQPTSKFSFANFLQTKGRLSRFINSGILVPSRREAEQYFSWVAEELGVISFNSSVQSIEYDADTRRYKIAHSMNETTQTSFCDYISIGTGSDANLFQGKAFNDSSRVTYASDGIENIDLENARKVLIVGSGQSGAEFFLETLRLLSISAKYPIQVKWITRDSSFRVLDTGHFAREFYHASFSRQFNAMKEPMRKKINWENRHAGTGISPWTAEEIYRALYEINLFAEPMISASLFPLTELKDISESEAGVVVGINQMDSNSETQEEFDCAILCLGRRQSSQEFVKECFELDEFGVASNYSIVAESIPEDSVFIQSDVVPSHGFAETNYVCAPSRNAVILNSILEGNFFHLQRVEGYTSYGK